MLGLSKGLDLLRLVRGIVKWGDIYCMCSKEIDENRKRLILIDIARMREIKGEKTLYIAHNRT